MDDQEEPTNRPEQFDQQNNLQEVKEQSEKIHTLETLLEKACGNIAELAGLMKQSIEGQAKIAKDVEILKNKVRQQHEIVTQTFGEVSELKNQVALFSAAQTRANNRRELDEFHRSINSLLEEIPRLKVDPVVEKLFRETLDNICKEWQHHDEDISQAIDKIEVQLADDIRQFAAVVSVQWRKRPNEDIKKIFTDYVPLQKYFPKHATPQLNPQATGTE